MTPKRQRRRELIAARYTERTREPKVHLRRRGGRGPWSPACKWKPFSWWLTSNDEDEVTCLLCRRRMRERDDS